MNIYVITDLEAGWNCIVGVFKASSEEKVAEYFTRGKIENDQDPLEWMEENNYIIHQRKLVNIE